MMSTTEIASAEPDQSGVRPYPRRWTRDEYYQLAELGMFQDQRVQLINGEIVVMSPMGTRHAAAMRLATQVLMKQISSPFELVAQLPMTFSDQSEPEPDFAIITGDPRDALAGHPTTALLIIEISDSTLQYDQTVKRALYAANAIPEYWIVNLKDGQIEVHLNLNSNEYQTVEIFKPDQQISVKSVPQLNVKVADLLP